MVHCDKPTGQIARTKFIYPELGDIDPNASKTERLKQLADIVTSPKDGRITRTIVNRLWAKFMGRGLVEPVDEMDNTAWNQDLLDWLASDLADNGYNLTHTIELILTSRAYQLPAVPMSEQTAKEFVFRGPVVRRLSAEEFLDALSTVTGVWHESPAAQIDYSVADPHLSRFVVEPKWVWKDANAPEKTETLTLYWRKEVDLAATPDEAVAVVSCDNSFKLFVNGKEAGAGNDHTQPRLINLKPHLIKGKNVIAVEAVNGRGKPEDKSADQANPAGLIFYGRIRKEPRAGGQRKELVMDLATDKSWRWSTTKSDGWQQPEFAAKDWQPAVELGDVEMAPWHLGAKFAAVISGAALRGQVRAALVNNDPLMTALGRPNREQVITTRASSATTLQALEMTNGHTLAELLKRGAEEVVARWPKPGRELIVDLYRRALGRKPTGEELRLAQEMVGSPSKKEGVEDLLWAMTMLPEFQLIY
jgi:hypothetical protein